MATSSEQQAPDNESGTDAPQRKRKRKRVRYEQWQIDLVIRHYGACDSPEEKDWLCEIAEIPDRKCLYHLASSLKLCRNSGVLSKREFEDFVSGKKDIVQAKKGTNAEDEDRLLTQREDPRTTVFTPEDDKYIIRNLGGRDLHPRMNIVQVAIARKHSETAVMYRARHLEVEEEEVLRDEDGNTIKGEDRKPLTRLITRPVRKPAVGFDLKRVAKWLGLEDEEVRALQRYGVVIVPMTHPLGEPLGEWVLARSLAPYLRKMYATLIRDRGADAWFIKEILETEIQLKEAAKVDAKDRVARIKAIEDQLGSSDLDPESRLTLRLEADQLRSLGAGPVAVTIFTQPEPSQEACFWLDHGHVCRNPYAGPLRGWFCNGADANCAELRTKDWRPE